MNNLDIYNAVKSVPQAAQKRINGGRLNGMTSINPMWRIKILTEQFGACGIGWYYEVERQWLEPYGNEVAAFVAIKMYVKVGGEWSKPICGIGGSMFVAAQKNGPHMSDDCYKMATTDAISVACKQLGVGADVYWDNDITKYTHPVQDINPERDAEPVPDASPAQSAACEEPTEETKRRFEKVMKELERTGYSVLSLCKTYKLDNYYDMTDLQIKDFLQKMKNVPDKKQGDE